MDPQLKAKVTIAVHETLRRMQVNMVMGGLPPLEAIRLLEGQLAKIRTTVENAIERSEGNDPAADVPVRGARDERSQAEAWMEARFGTPAREGEQPPVVRREQLEESPSPADVVEQNVRDNTKWEFYDDTLHGADDNDPF